MRGHHIQPGPGPVNAVVYGAGGLGPNGGHLPSDGPTGSPQRQFTHHVGGDAVRRGPGRGGGRAGEGRAQVTGMRMSIRTCFGDHDSKFSWPTDEP